MNDASAERIEMSCKFCRNVVHADGICLKHYTIIERIKAGEASPTLCEIYSAQKRAECYVPINATVLFGYSKVPILHLALFFCNKPHRQGSRYTRTCNTRNCVNGNHLLVGGKRTDDETTKELRANKNQIDRMIRDTAFELCCKPGFVVQDNAKIWTYYDNRKILLGTALLNHHIGSQQGSAVRLCDTLNCYNQLHYKWGISTDQEKLRKKRHLFDKPDVPPEIEWELWNKYKQMKIEDITIPIILTTLSKHYKTTPDIVQAIIAWSKFR